ncbi:glycoside hydrolase family 73 protein [Limosilactobacillus difficilis]|uniref:glycoside hydrolase family 73 protein n=1 Tax=Limosilactobacillus difficilis TaxID=2991838 RepID=UPI0024B9929C|nr:glucosaminidase domain-containing protein [Limosilactobacillus difficilis]
MKQITKCILSLMIFFATMTSAAQATAFSPAERDRYLAGYRQGLMDGQQHLQHQFQDLFVRAGYDRGWRDGAAKTGQADQARNSQSNSNSNCQPAQAPAFRSVQVPPAGRNNDRFELACPTTKQEAFFKQLSPVALKVCRKYDLYPSILLAQAALESNWGTSELASHYFNLLGVKASAGLPSVVMATSEQDKDGHPFQIAAAFRKYKDWNESLTDYAHVLEDKRYEGIHRHESSDYHRALRSLNGNYATDTHYDQKLEAVIKAFSLSKYDQTLKQQLTAKSEKHDDHWRANHSRRCLTKMRVKSEKARPKRRNKLMVLVTALTGAASASFWINVKKLHR